MGTTKELDPRTKTCQACKESFRAETGRQKFCKRLQCANKRKREYWKKYIVGWMKKKPNYYKKYLVEWKKKNPDYHSEWRKKNKDYFKNYYRRMKQQKKKSEK